MLTKVTDPATAKPIDVTHQVCIYLEHKQQTNNNNAMDFAEMLANRTSLESTSSLWRFDSFIGRNFMSSNCICIGKFHWQKHHQLHNK